MKLIVNKKLRCFTFSSAKAKENARFFSEADLDNIDTELEKRYPYGLTKFDIECLFAEQRDFVAKLAGYKNYMECMEIKIEMMGTLIRMQELEED